MQQQLAHPFRNVVLEVAVTVFVDMNIVEESLVVLDADETITDLRFSRAQGFYFRSLQHDAGFIGLENVIVPPSFRISDDIRHKKISQKAALLAGTKIRASLPRGLVFFALPIGMDGFSRAQFFRHLETDLFINDFG